MPAHVRDVFFETARVAHGLSSSQEVARRCNMARCRHGDLAVVRALARSERDEKRALQVF